MLKRTVVVAVVAFAAAAAVHAAGQNDAGCGLGSLVFKNNSPAEQILAATTNGISGNQTFGITTGTLGCSSGGIIKAEKEREVFIAVNFRNLSKELAAGQGEYATSFAGLLGCKKEAVPTFLSFTKLNYELIIPTAQATPVEVLKNVETQIAADPILSQACTL